MYSTSVFPKLFKLFEKEILKAYYLTPYKQNNNIFLTTR